MLTAIIFLIVLAVLIFVHELGHFLFAKLFKIRVDAFKIGFGPKVFAWKAGETEYGLNLIPFGGYVKIYGENPEDDNTVAPASAPAFVKAEHSRSISHRPRWQQLLVLFGGVFFNFLFATIVYIGLFAHGVTATSDGFPKYTSYFSNQRIMITEVMQGSPAEKAGLRAGDVILEEQGIDAIQAKINDSKGGEISLDIDRGSEPASFKVVPASGIVEGKYAIGIAMSDVADMKLPFLTAIYEGGYYAWLTLENTVSGLWSFVAQAFHGKADINQIAGPVGIAGVVGDAARLGLTYLLMITALISINLAVINLIPFPALDGGRILVVLVESIIRRPLPARAVNIVNTVGFALLMLLMIVITYRDIVKLVG